MNDITSAFPLPNHFEGQGYISSYDDTRNAALRYLRTQKETFLDAIDIIPHEILEEVYESIATIGTYKELIPNVADFGLQIKRNLFKAKREDLWYGILMQLYFIINHSLRLRPEDKYEWLDHLYQEIENLAKVKVNADNIRAVLNETLEKGFQNNPKRWLLASIEYFKWSFVKEEYTYDSALERASRLLKAAQETNVYLQMRVYLILSGIHLRYRELEKSFLYAQQAFIIGAVLQKQFLSAACVNVMLQSINVIKNSILVDNLIKYWEDIPLVHKDPVSQAFYLGTLGMVFYNRKDYQRAAQNQGAALKTFQKLGGYLRNQGFTSMGLAMSLLQLELYDTAEPTVQNAIRIFTDLGQAIERVWAMHIYGWGFLKKGDLERAIQHLTEALEEAQKLEPSKQRDHFIATIEEGLSAARLLL
jgi:tetratricopeptide (TPR) repeat protein